MDPDIETCLATSRLSSNSTAYRTYLFWTRLGHYAFPFFSFHEPQHLQRNAAVFLSHFPTHFHCIFRLTTQDTPLLSHEIGYFSGHSLAFFILRVTCCIFLGWRSVVDIPRGYLQIFWEVAFAFVSFTHCFVGFLHVGVFCYLSGFLDTHEEIGVI